MTLSAVPETEMPMPLPGAVDQGTTRVAYGITHQRLGVAANVTAIKGLSCNLVGCGVAVGLGNGGLAVVDGEGTTGPDLPPHGAAVTGLAGLENTLYSIAQDSKLYAHELSSGASSLLFSSSGQWLSSLTTAPKTGFIAFVSGKTAFVLPTSASETGASDYQFTEHPSSLSGLAFSPDGRRLAVSHYDGITLWPLDGSGKGEVLRWKGYHIGVSWSPDGRFIVSATQERELHVWDLVAGKDYRLGGYPAKIHELEWTSPENGPAKLVCSGADVITAWPFGDVGPGRLPPVEIGYVYSGRVTSVAAHPNRALVAGGYTTGTVLIGGLQKGEAAYARIADDQEISALDWVNGGRVLAAGTRSGTLDLITVGDLKVQ